MRNFSWTLFSASLLAASHLVACSGDDDNRTTGTGGRAGAAGAGGSHPGSGGSGGSHLDASAGAGGGAGFSTGGAAGSGGAGDGGEAGTGGSGELDAEAEAATDAAEPEPDVEAPEACAPEPESAFCARYQKNCGSFNALDTCDAPYVGSCGVCSDASTCGGGGTLNVCSGTGPINRAQGGVVTASRAVDKAVESFTMVFDNDIKTKWFAREPTVWVAYQFAGGARYAIDSYTVTSANDKPERDPMSWELQGSNDGGLTWSTVDTRVNQTFASRFQTNSYSFTNATAYSAYRFLVTANAGSSTQFQVAEIQLFETPASAPEGGAPDAAEDGSTAEDAEAGNAEDVLDGGPGGEGAAEDAGTTDAAAADDASADTMTDSGAPADDASLEAASE
jgi:hypothetical protein